MANFTVDKDDLYQPALVGVTGFSTLKLDTYSGAARIAFSTSAAPPDVAAGDANGFSLTAGQGWIGRTLNEVWPSATTWTHVHVRALSAAIPAVGDAAGV